MSGNTQTWKFKRAQFKKLETCTVFLSSYRNTSESLGERKMLWEHEPQVSVSTAILELSQTITSVSITQ